MDDLRSGSQTLRVAIEAAARRVCSLLLLEQGRVRSLGEIECLLGKPCTCGGVIDSPERIEERLTGRVSRPSSWVVDAVVPGANSALRVAGSVRLAGCLHPEVGVQECYTGVCSRGLAQSAGRWIAPVAVVQSRDDRGGLGIRRILVGSGVEGALSVAAGINEEVGGGNRGSQVLLEPLVGVNPRSDVVRINSAQRRVVLAGTVGVVAEPPTAVGSIVAEGNALGYPSVELCFIRRKIIVRHVREETLGLLHTRRNKALRDGAHGLPMAVAAIEIDHGLRSVGELGNSEVELRVAIGGGLRDVHQGRVVTAIAGKICDGIRLEKNDSFLCANGRGDGGDPRLVVRCVLSATRGIATAVASGNVIEHEDGDGVLQVCLLQSLGHGSGRCRRSPAGKPYRLRGRLCRCNQQGILKLEVLQQIHRLLDGTCSRRWNEEAGVWRQNLL